MNYFLQSNPRTVNHLSEPEIQQVVDILHKLDPNQPLPTKLCDAIIRVVSQPIIEIVPWRINPKNKKIELLYIRRGINDPHWPNQLHTPGVIVRPSDGNDYRNIILRLVRDELGGVKWEKLNFLMIMMAQGVRGHEMGFVFGMKLDNNLDMAQYGEWYEMDKFPQDCIQEQIPWLNKAIKLIKYESV